jgi:7-carboxy-7-deazaguanine synthase
VQGEGPYVGVPTTFIRFGECDLRCGWCDSPGTWRPARQCRIETRAESAEFTHIENPVDLPTVLAALDRLELRAGDLVSLTGGEPLLQPEAVRELAEELQRRRARVYLETHGLEAEALDRVVAFCDVVSMDWKLASDVRRASDPARGKVEDFHEQHERFLQVALRADECFVKIVLTGNTTDEELENVCHRLARISPESPLILQPVTPFARVQERPSAAQLLGWRRFCSQWLEDVRLIPQTHPVYGAL